MRGRLRSVAIGLLIATTIAIPTGAAANPTRYCSKPFEPTVFITKPTKPFCAASRSCSDWEVSNYKREVEDHFRKLKRYLVEIDEYYEQAYQYARCMSELE